MERLIPTLAAFVLGAAVMTAAPSPAAQKDEPTMSCQRLNDGAYWKCRLYLPKTNHAKIRVYRDGEWFATTELWFGWYR